MVVGESDQTSATGPGSPVEDDPTLPRGDASAPPTPTAAVDAIDELEVTQSSALSMRRQDAARARGFARLVGLLCAVGLVSQLLMGGALWLRVLFSLSLLALGATAAQVWWVTRHPLDYRPSLARAFGAVAAVTSLVISMYLGVLSPAPMFVVLGVAFFASLIFFLVFRHRHGIDAGKPAMEIDVVATARAERTELRSNGFAADRESGAALNIRHEGNMGRATGRASSTER